MSVSLLFPAYNRLEFTKQSWYALQSNTNWSEVSEFHVYDDGSTDGTREWLTNQLSWIKPIFHSKNSIFHDTNHHSPMGVTLDWIRSSKAPILAKLDNDAIYPPDWLDISVNVMAANPELDMLGLECMREPSIYHGAHETVARVPVYCDANRNPCRFRYLPARFVSGLGLYRASAFAQTLPKDNGYYGFEEWMEATKSITSGWILPSLPVFLLDRMPTEPWRSLSEQYIKAGWQREWSRALRYKPEQSKMWDWWHPESFEVKRGELE